jgi:hypothetical protein
VYFRAPDGFIWKLEVCLDAVERMNHSTLLDGDLYVSRAERTQASSMYFVPCACPVGVSRYPRLGAEAINTLYASAGMRDIRAKPADITEHVVSDYADVDVKVVPKVKSVKPAVSKTDPATEAFYQERLRSNQEGVVLPTERKMVRAQILEGSLALVREIALIEMAKVENARIGDDRFPEVSCRKINDYRMLIGYTERKNTKE